MSHYELLIGWPEHKLEFKDVDLQKLIKKTLEYPVQSNARIYEVTLDGYRVKVWPNK